eukprot:4686160-Ditylum_brightwellii.AAC.1
MQSIIKCKQVEKAEGMFNLVEALLEGDALTHWLEFKQVETACTSKNLDGTNIDPLGMSPKTFKVYMQELKKHYFPKNWLA